MIERNRLISMVTQAQNGNNEALNDLICECYQGLYYFALKTIHDPELAADATQDACEEIVKTIGKLEEPLGFIKWARQIVYHRCLRNNTKETRIPMVENDEELPILDRVSDEDAAASPEEYYDHKELCETLNAFMDSLPEEQRAALLLYYYENMSVKEIAEIQGVSEGTVKSRLNYGRNGVKKKVEDYEERTGTKLHAFLPLPILLFRFFEDGFAGTVMPSTPSLSGLLSGTAAAGGATAAAGGASAAGGTAAAVGTAVGTASQAATMTVAAKIAIGLIATAIVAAGAFGVSTLMEKDSSNVGNGGTGGQNGDGTAHVHVYDEIRYDADSHWFICDCGDPAEKMTHTYRDGACSDCGVKAASEGLYMIKKEDHYLVGGIGTCTDTDIVFPSEYNGLPVKGFDGWAMQSNTSVVSVVLPSTYTVIGDRVFWGCSALRQVTLPEELIYLSEYAFWDCTLLTEINIPENVTRLPHFTFSGCTSLTSIDLPDRLSEIGTGAFNRCTALTEITIPAGVTRIAESAFNRCTSLRDVYFLGTVAEWNAIDRSETSFEANNMALEGMNFTVHCVDGDV